MAATCWTKGCPEREELRARYGCDDEAGRGYGIECYACQGEPGRSSRCPVCEDRRGVRAIWFDRCPNHVLPMETTEFLSSIGEADDGILPEAGGMNDQAAIWVEFYRFGGALIDRAVERDREARRKRRR